MWLFDRWSSQGLLFKQIMIQQGDMEDRHRKVGKSTDEITAKIGGLVELREGRFRDGMFRPFIYHHHLHSSSQVWWKVSLISPNSQSELANLQCASRAHMLELTTLWGTHSSWYLSYCVSVVWYSSLTLLPHQTISNLRAHMISSLLYPLGQS